ncbi:MAG: potassium transporter TrkG, partial [Lachnospiraceae bacterium]
TVMFKRRVEESIVRQASAILMMYLVLCGAAAMAISRLEGVPLLSALFETSSAIGTVGLSLGLTPHFGVWSHLILILLMYFGRVGGLTILYAAIRRSSTGARCPKETLTVG